MIVTRFIFLSLLKVWGYVIYPSRFQWLSEKPESWDDVSLVLILNHTSLFEFIYGVGLPYRFLWNLSKRLVIPVADSTLKNPIAGFVFSNLAPKTIGLSRKRDETWNQFLGEIERDDICIFFPEGEMKRKNGLNKKGRPMTVKEGVYELLTKFSGKNMVILYSKGLHHILAPGERVPKIFKKVEARVEYMSVNDYLGQFGKSDESVRKRVVSDLQKKRDRYCHDS